MIKLVKYVCFPQIETYKNNDFRSPLNEISRKKKEKIILDFYLTTLFKNTKQYQNTTYEISRSGQYSALIKIKRKVFVDKMVTGISRKKIKAATIVKKFKKKLSNIK